MKVLLVYPLHIRAFEQALGVLYVSAVLKQHGHETKLFRLNKEEDWNFEKNPSVIEKRFLDVLHHFKPDIVGMSLFITNFHRGQCYKGNISRFKECRLPTGKHWTRGR
ncbi:MAG TPA: hypothetical protein ACFYEH_02315 [Candidatus Brocadiaceae bacterium]